MLVGSGLHEDWVDKTRCVSRYVLFALTDGVQATRICRPQLRMLCAGRGTRNQSVGGCLLKDLACRAGDSSETA